MSLGYDKRVRPNYGGPPVAVNVTMRILSISSVSEVMMDFTADFYFRQFWHDPRLSFKKLGDIQTLYVGAEVSKKIWLPDTFFGNEKMVSLLQPLLLSGTFRSPPKAAISHTGWAAGVTALLRSKTEAHRHANIGGAYVVRRRAP